MRTLEARYSAVHNLTMALVAAGMIAAAIWHFATSSANAPTLSLNDPRFVLFAMLAVALGYYVFLGFDRSRNRKPQVLIDAQGIALGFGRDRRFAWTDIEWVRLRRLALRPQLEIGVAAEAFAAANLRLSAWNFDDGLRPVRGMPSAVLVRDNGLDRSASAMLDAIRSFRPNLVRP
ncbi:MAG: hypothetical protein JOY64_03785 [Alphaproteobacteria bacterium]|nr:hypothetical protein [Alphaproteobacteria bacterium]MBV8406726.1 hypothetical protein [Alphaproteobacteria bacterium]